MIAKIRRFLSPALKEKILNSLPYRFLSRIKLYKHEIRFSCELTTRCNLECDMCTRKSLVEKGQLCVGDMDEKIVRRIIEEIKKFHNHSKNVYFVPMGLGEPLLYKGLFDLFRDIKNISKKIGIVLVTNGILLNKAYCKKLISLGVDQVCISLNTAKTSSYRQHMRVNAYDIVRRNIENLINLRNKNSDGLPSVFIQYIDYDNNQKLYQEDIKRWSKIMRYNDKCFVHPIVNQAGFFSGGNNFASSERKFPCTQPLWRVAVKVNGDMYPCDSCLYSGSKKIAPLYLGNIMTESPFEQLADKNNKRFAVIKSMRKDDYSELPECEKCNTYKLDCNNYFKLPGSLRIKGYKWL